MSKLSDRWLWKLALRSIDENEGTITFALGKSQMRDGTLFHQRNLTAEELLSFSRNLEALVKYFDDRYVWDELTQPGELVMPDIRKGLP